MTSSTLKRNGSPADDFSYTVIIPAYNEENMLPATLSSLHQAMNKIPCPGEIIVVDNNSTDNTASVALEHKARVVYEPFRQIARARNCGAEAAHTKYLVFLDADTTLPPQLLQKALELLSSGKYCGGGTLIGFDTRLPFLASKLVGFWNWLSIKGKLAAGSFIFCLARGFRETGGFDENIYAAEEITFSQRIKRWGKENGFLFTIISDYTVTTSDRKFRWYSSMQISLLLLLFTVFPFALRNRTLCSFWYNRPDRPNESPE